MENGERRKKTAKSQPEVEQMSKKSIVVFYFIISFRVLYL
jgi:hypothetical protein